MHREVRLHLPIDGSQQVLHPTAFVLLLGRVGGYDHLFEVNRLLLHYDRHRVTTFAGLRQLAAVQLAQQQSLLLIADKRDNEFAEDRQVSLYPKQPVAARSGSDDRIIRHIDRGVTYRRTFLIHYTADVLCGVGDCSEAEKNDNYL